MPGFFYAVSMLDATKGIRNLSFPCIDNERK